MAKNSDKEKAVAEKEKAASEKAAAGESKSKGSSSVAISEAKLKLAQNAIEQIEKAYGKGSIMRLNDENVVAVDAIPTGCLSFVANCLLCSLFLNQFFRYC